MRRYLCIKFEDGKEACFRVEKLIDKAKKELKTNGKHPTMEIREMEENELRYRN